MTTLYVGTVHDAKAMIDDLIGTGSVTAISLGESKGKWYLDWETRVPKRRGFLGYDADRCANESVFEAIAIEGTMSPEILSSMRAKLETTVKWIDCDEMGWRKRYADQVAGKTRLVKRTLTTVTGFGSLPGHTDRDLVGQDGDIRPDVRGE